MKRKHYLRGLGTGILVTALIMMIVSGQKDTMTDEEVRARAKELGMVESTLLSELANQAQPETTPSAEEQKPQPGQASPTEETESEQGREPEPPPETLPTEETESEQGREPEPQPETLPDAEEQKPEAETSVTIEIHSGESSVAVSRTLAEAGLVESAASYDSYLCRNGYDRKIRAGAYEIPAGASDEEIAKIITRR